MKCEEFLETFASVNMAQGCLVFDNTVCILHTVHHTR